MIKIFAIANAQIPSRLVPDCDPVGGCGKAELYQMAANIINLLIGLGLLLGVVFFLWGGFVFLTSGGSEERIASGKKTITAAIVGIVIVLVAWIAINTFIEFFTDCTGEWYRFESLSCV